MVELTEQQLARQRKKVEKDRRRKVYEDLQVQGTNNSSIVSKRSVEKLYNSQLNPEIGQWFHHFVKNGKRRSPAINRGYWIRMESIKRMVTRIIDQNRGKKVQIINLGCGFDPLPFQLLSDNNNQTEYEFLDVDFPDLIKNKYDMILEADPILQIINYKDKEEPKPDLGIIISTSNYKLIGCDLKDFTKYERILKSLLKEDYLKIFIAEVSLAYMEPKDANEIIKISSEFSQTHFLILEQTLPQGIQNAFAQKMKKHFEHLRHPIKCINDYPTEKAQIERFGQWFSQVEIGNLFENWKFLISDEMKAKIAEIEDFDEWEEFIIFCQHYILCHATNQTQLIYPLRKSLEIELEVDEDYKIKTNDLKFELKFPAMTMSNDDIIIHGGLGQSRSGDMMRINDKVPIEVSNGPSARMAHTMTTMLDGTIVLIGGRTRPGNDLKDVHAYKDGKWEHIGELPYGVSRHSVVAIDADRIVIMSRCGVVIYNIRSNACTIPKNNLDLKLSSCCLVNGWVLGGAIDENGPEINDSLYQWELNGDEVTFTKKSSNHLFCRLGGNMHFEEDKLVIIGGVSPELVFNESTNVITYDVSTQKIKLIKFDDEMYKQTPPMLIGFGSVKTSKGIEIGCGGGVCYSFGSAYNFGYTISRQVTERRSAH